jgi:hypothetical protein
VQRQARFLLVDVREDDVHRQDAVAHQVLPRLLERVDRDGVVLLVEDDLADRRVERSGLDGHAGGDEDHVDIAPPAPPLAELKAVHGERIGADGGDEHPCRTPITGLGGLHRTLAPRPFSLGSGACCSKAASCSSPEF